MSDRRTMGHALPFVGIVTFVTVWLGGSTALVGSVVAPRLPGGWLTVFGVVALYAVPMTVLTRGFTGVAYPRKWTRLLVLRPFWYAMLFMPLLAGTGLLAGVIGVPFGEARVFAEWGVAVAGVALAVAAVIGWFGTRRLVVRPLTVSIPNLPAAFDGFRIVQISDTHVGPHTSRRVLGRMHDAICAAEPDLLVSTGDQVDDFPPDIPVFLEGFGDCEAPHGRFAIIGNHDVFAGWEGVRQGLEAGGFRMLVNDAVPIERGGARIWLAGTGDPAARGWSRGGGPAGAPDVERTLAKVPDGACVVALAHNPAVWPALAKRGVALTLSGHTHYGQVAIPALNWCLASPFLKLAMGMHRRGDSMLYINPGTNYWGIPLRLGTPPEVTVITLRLTEAPS